MPESTAGGPNVGVRELTSGLTLEGLTQVGADGKAVPRLAEKWNWENGFLSLRLTLQAGVTLHDGSTLDSARVAAALRQQISRPGNRALYPSFSDITEVRTEGNRDLIIDLARRSAFLPEDLDLSLAFGPDNTGSGPFRIVPGDTGSVVLESFDQYYLGRPRIGRIVVRPFDTLRIAWTSLLRDELDMVTDVPPDAVEFIRNDDIQVIPFARWYQYLIAFNSRRGPLESSVVRRALNLAIDRPALIKNLLEGRGTPSTGPLWPRYWAYDNSVGAYSYDPQLAASLLDQAGYRVGAAPGDGDSPPARLRFTCLIPAGFDIWERIALELQRSLYNVGVDMQFQVVTFQEFDARVREGRFDAAFLSSISGPTPSRAYIFWQSARHHKGLNIFGYENDEAARIFEVLRSEANEGAVRSATRRLQAVFLQDPPALFIAWNERARVVRREFNIVQQPDRDPMLNMWQWAPAAPQTVVATQ